MEGSRESRLPALYALASRGLVALFFFGDGLLKVVRPDRAVEGLSGMGLSFPVELNYLGAVIEIGGALCLLTDVRVWAASLLLALYLLSASFLKHVPVANAQPAQLLEVLRDAAVAGGLILLAGVHRHGRRR
ncbi:MAG TPA: DoxX family membrane protein [Gemmatimonadota bacterium]